MVVVVVVDCVGEDNDDVSMFSIDELNDRPSLEAENRISRFWRSISRSSAGVPIGELAVETAAGAFDGVDAGVAALIVVVVVVGGGGAAEVAGVAAAVAAVVDDDDDDEDADVAVG